MKTSLKITGVITRTLYMCNVKKDKLKHYQHPEAHWVNFHTTHKHTHMYVHTQIIHVKTLIRGVKTRLCLWLVSVGLG